MNESHDAHTPRVLKQCLDLFDSSRHDTYPKTAENHRFADHPDIQYFQRVKLKNHYNYHKFKRTPKRAPQSPTSHRCNFDPFSRELLLERLSTYSPLSWNLPSVEENGLSELKCAQNGWKCISISINEYTKNHLMCTSCMHILTLRFNEISSLNDNEHEYGFDIDQVHDLNQLNAHLCTMYSDQIQSSGHDANCPWKNFETPLAGVYYMNPFLDSTNEALLNGYLANLRDLVENNTVIVNKAEHFQSLMDSKYNCEQLLEFIKASNNLLLDKFYQDIKENKGSLLELIPPWFYLIALLGWDLKVQSFADHLVLFLTCADCNKKLFLDQTSHPQVQKDTSHLPVSTGLSLSASKILTPVKFPPSDLNKPSQFGDPLADEEEIESFDLLAEHKHWCFKRRAIDGNDILIDYIFNLVINTNKHEDDMEGQTFSQKRKPEFDVKEGLERLNKLRKLYLVDD